MQLVTVFLLGIISLMLAPSIVGIENAGTVKSHKLINENVCK